MREVSTPQARSSPATRCPSACSGSAPIHATGTPSAASATATFDSAPPTVTWNRSASASSSPRGGESRSIASPSVTTSAGCAGKEQQLYPRRAQLRPPGALRDRDACSPGPQPATGVVQADAEGQAVVYAYECGLVTPGVA